MKQLLQSLSDGRLDMLEVPTPKPPPGHVLIQTVVSLVSPGTERMLLNFGRSNMFEKARQQPDKVQQVLSKIKSDGLMPTMDAVRSKLETPIALGYSNVGRVVALGEGVTEFKLHDRVLSNGPHAEFVCVSKNLCARIPDEVSDEDASFAVLGAIALQGIRLAAPSFGECFAVMGTGLLGLISIQLLKANGCRVLAFDYKKDRLDLAKSFGAEVFNLAGGDPVHFAETLTYGNGVDGVLMTLATDADQPIQQAAAMSRKRGRIILVGITGLKLRRDDFYKKELQFQVSCSYGPGRHDASYEKKSNDYPFGLVRWTAKRNFEAVLGAMNCGQLSVEKMKTLKADFQEAVKVYDFISKDASGLGILFHYGFQEKRIVTNIPLVSRKTRVEDSVSVGVIGAGQYASRHLLPHFAATGVRLHTLVTNAGINSSIHGKKFGFEFASSNPQEIFENSEINTVVIATRHDSHAKFVLEALKAGKNVFVEKPLALRSTDVSKIQETYYRNQHPPALMVGFNRRFSPLVQELKASLSERSPDISILYTINAGKIDPGHWSVDPDSGGNRLVGEACHFIDLCRFLAGQKIVEMTSHGHTHRDHASLMLRFSEGAMANIVYWTNGSKNFPKERVEVFSDGSVFQVDNFRNLTTFGSKVKTQKLWAQNKGQKEMVDGFVQGIRSGHPLISPEEIFEVSHFATQLFTKLESKESEELPPETLEFSPGEPQDFANIQV